MTNRTAIPSSQGYSFLNSKVARFIETLKKVQFSGQLIWTHSTHEKKWIFYFHRGHIFYATGGAHALRRWIRSLAIYCPQLQVNVSQLQQSLRRIPPGDPALSWEYHLLCLWVKQRQLTQEQVKRVIQTILSELLFELSQIPDLTHQIQKAQSVSEPLVLVDECMAFANVQKLWQSLRNCNIDPGFLDKAPIIQCPDQVQQWSPTDYFQALIQLLDGEKTLRDLAVQVGKDVVQLTDSLLPYIRSGVVELISVPDLSTPVDQDIPAKRFEQSNVGKPLIACVDDSVIVCWTMEKLLTEAGYQFVGINDGLRAITTLLSCKPDLIFLDVFMPNTNGYEICRNLRKAPSFRNTPIVFLTGLDGVVDQVRARLAGASDFLSKPVDADRVLNTVAQYLIQGAIVP